MPKVSVIIPTYNCAHYLGQAIESAMNQTYRDLEIIVLDDGSTDDTPQVMRKYGANIKYIKQENQGLPAARNHAIKSSSGEFIALLDADDWWEAEKLAEQVPILNGDSQLCLVYTDLEVIHSDGTITPSFLSSRPLATSGYVFDQLLQSSFILPSTVLLRRTCLEQVGMFDESMRSHEDIDLWLRLCQRWKVTLIGKSLTHRRQGPTSMTSNDSLRTEYGVKVLTKALSLPNLTVNQRLMLARQLERAHFSRGYFYFSTGHPKECRNSFLQALRYRKWNCNAWIYYIFSFFPSSVITCISRGKKLLRTTQKDSSQF